MGILETILVIAITMTVTALSIMAALNSAFSRGLEAGQEKYERLRDHLIQQGYLEYYQPDSSSDETHLIWKLSKTDFEF
jgi:hypothetical protein